jgi:hypothetical protein
MREESTEETNQLDLLWGASAIAAYIGVDQRQAFWMLEKGRLPAKRIGSRWVASRSNLQKHFLDTEAS